MRFFHGPTVGHIMDCAIFRKYNPCMSPIPYAISIHQLKRSKIVYFLALVSFTAISQSSLQDEQSSRATLLTPSMFSTRHDIQIGNLDGWIFREGNDASWAEKEINPSGWIPLKPKQLASKKTNTPAEGWFRITLRVDSAFNTVPLGIRMGTWAAVDVYVNGVFVHAFGNTDLQSGKFEPYNPYYKFPVPVSLIPGTENTIALHVVDNAIRLLPNWGEPNSFIKLTNDHYVRNLYESFIDFAKYQTIWFSILIVLSLFFWLLVYLNPAMKNLNVIALCTSIIFMAFLSSSSPSSTGSLFFLRIQFFSSMIFWGLMVGIIPAVISGVIKNHIPRWIKIFFLLSPILMTADQLLFTPGFLAGLTVLSSVSVSFGIIVTSWKRLQAPQWAIVIGVMLTITLILSSVGSYALGTENSETYRKFGQYLGTGITLSFPVSLLVYIALQFKANIRETREHAEKIVQVTEEKKEILAQQNVLLEQQVSERTQELSQSLENLKTAQAQLIQAEKMASLGELTAGIAHEIQNPLNFVNNFSEVNSELVSELEAAASAGNFEEIKLLARDIKDNEEKINHHGKRADSIVKSMLQHSKKSSGQKEPTDINALCEEYLHLSYHGYRAKDKSFNANYETDFDPTLPNINVVPQDMCRVILNIINNAFYACNERYKVQGSTFLPLIMVSTKNLGDKIEIMIKDNGNGIPESIKEKIFQPFFTTKPTGQGTGLGLSLSYDIVKAHGGELRVDSQAGNGTTFVIILPA